MGVGPFMTQTSAPHLSQPVSTWMPPSSTSTASTTNQRRQEHARSSPATSSAFGSSHSNPSRSNRLRTVSASQQLARDFRLAPLANNAPMTKRFTLAILPRGVCVFTSVNFFSFLLKPFIANHVISKRRCGSAS